MSVKARPVVCPNCDQPGDRYPGLKLGEYDLLDAVWVQDESVPTPQKLTCNLCGYEWPVARGSIEVRKP